MLITFPQPFQFYFFSRVVIVWRRPLLVAALVPRLGAVHLLYYSSAKSRQERLEGGIARHGMACSRRPAPYLIGGVLDAVEGQVLVESLAVPVGREQGVAGSIVPVFGFVLADGGIGACKQTDKRKTMSQREEQLGETASVQGRVAPLRALFSSKFTFVLVGPNPALVARDSFIEHCSCIANTTGGLPGELQETPVKFRLNKLHHKSSVSFYLCSVGRDRKTPRSTVLQVYDHQVYFTGVPDSPRVYVDAHWYNSVTRRFLLVQQCSHDRHSCSRPSLPEHLRLHGHCCNSVHTTLTAGFVITPFWRRNLGDV